ncbi:unnamed protein product [Camellia sinensis]
MIQKNLDARKFGTPQEDFSEIRDRFYSSRRVKQRREVSNQKLAAQYIHRQLREADEANLLDEEVTSSYMAEHVVGIGSFGIVFSKMLGNYGHKKRREISLGEWEVYRRQRNLKKERAEKFTVRRTGK